MQVSETGILVFLSLAIALPPSTVLPSLSPGDIVPTVTRLPPVTTTLPSLSPGDIVPIVTHLSSMTTTLPSLSPGATAGIAVGTIIGLVMIVGILLLIILCGVLVAGTWIFLRGGVWIWDMMFTYKSISRKIPEA